MIIGITGPLGAGKDTAAEYISATLGIPHISGGDILRSMLRSAGLEPKKTAIGDFGTFIRTHYGTDAILNVALDKGEESGSVIVSGFRSFSEAKLIKNRGGVIMYIDAPSAIRHERVVRRARVDEITSLHMLEKLDEQESSSKNAKAENLQQVKKLAHMVICNDGSIDEFYRQLDDVIPSLIKK